MSRSTGLVAAGLFLILAAGVIHLTGQRAAAEECDYRGVERVFGVQRPARERAASSEVETGRVCRVRLHGHVREVSLSEWDYSTPAISTAVNAHQWVAPESVKPEDLPDDPVAGPA